MNNLRNLALWIIIALLLVALFNMFQGTGSHANASAITYTQFNQEVMQGGIKAVTMQGEPDQGHAFQRPVLHHLHARRPQPRQPDARPQCQHQCSAGR